MPSDGTAVSSSVVTFGYVHIETKYGESALTKVDPLLREQEVKELSKCASKISLQWTKQFDLGK